MNNDRDIQDRKIMVSIQKPIMGEAGKTGSWRTLRPVINLEKCVVVKLGKPTCHQCWLYCPEAVISRTIPPKIDLDYCKGCGICSEICPSKAIGMVPEHVKGDD